MWSDTVISHTVKYRLVPSRRGRLASYTQQLHLSITAVTLTLPLHKSDECTRLLFQSTDRQTGSAR